jgi:hypothetical protein
MYTVKRGAVLMLNPGRLCNYPDKVKLHGAPPTPLGGNSPHYFICLDDNDGNQPNPWRRWVPITSKGTVDIPELDPVVVGSHEKTFVTATPVGPNEVIEQVEQLRVDYVAPAPEVASLFAIPQSAKKGCEHFTKTQSWGDKRAVWRILDDNVQRAGAFNDDINRCENSIHPAALPAL